MPAELIGCAKCSGGAFKGYTDTHTRKNASGDLQQKDGRGGYICYFMTCC